MTVDHQPRFTPTQECRVPQEQQQPEPLSDTQTAALNALRTHIHETVVKTETHRRWADDRCLIRYLKSKKWNLQEAKQAVQDTMLWRDQYGPNRPDKDALWTETAVGKLYVSGFDTESRPLLYMKPRLENTAASPSQIRHVVYHLETAIALMPEGVEKLCIIIDFAGSSMTKNPGVAVAREIINVLGNHYPERLGKGYIIHAPWFFFPFFKLISPFIDPVTKAKINFVDMKKQKPSSKSVISAPSSATASEIELPGSSAASTTSSTKKQSSSSSNSGSKDGTSSDQVNLLDVIPEDMLEREFGGSSDYVYNQQVYWDAAAQVLADSRARLETGSSSNSTAVVQEAA
ncbi:MAG: CRAL-TRIO domain-containing protein [Linnemannia gamsii]|nr:MAG: CRAL-TRIO domain-containing protein [Linnemannia gamsii]